MMVSLRLTGKVPDDVLPNATTTDDLIDQERGAR